MVYVVVVVVAAAAAAAAIVVDRFYTETRRDGSNFAWHQPCKNQTAL